MVAFATLLLAFADAKPVVVQPATADARKVTVIANLPKSVEAKTARRRLTFALLDETGKPGEPMFGRYEFRGKQLRFTPRFRLLPGHRYRATLRLVNGKAHSVYYSVPAAKSTKAAVVTAVYPSGNTLPANNLKFHIHFSQPMREGKAIFERIQLLDDKGKPVPDSWRRVEIWSNAYQTFTLYIHPGRIKTGVNLRTEIGPVLEPGRKYRLVIPRTVVNASGTRLSRSFEIRFRATAPDHARPLPTKWKLTAPGAKTRQPIQIAFGEPLDRLLLQSMLEIKDGNSRKIAGVITIDKHEQRWSFTPTKPWIAGEYSLIVDRDLEDLAGNTPVRLFDRDLEKPRSPRPRLVLRFRVK